MDSPWKIRLSGRARRQLAELPTKGMRAEVVQALRELRQEPWEANSAALQSHRMHRKVYLSRGYRIIYRISEPHRVIFIDRIRPHDKVYSGFGD